MYIQCMAANDTKEQAMSTYTLSENSNAHGTERLLGLLQHDGIEEVVYKLGDAGGHTGVVAHIEIGVDADGDYSFDGAGDGMFWDTLDEAVAAAKARLA